MTDRDPIPLAPTCPVCISRERVERQKPARWLCSTCWTLFTGSQGEWESFRYMRELYAKRQNQSEDA